MAGIYIHIPFCKQACSYCDFHFSTKLANKQEVLHSMHNELKLRASYLNNKVVDSIYFGGGTPSLLNKHELTAFFDIFSKHFMLNKDLEITLEANPDDLTIHQLKNIYNSGINRLSIGVQSFFDSDLQFMNRVHNGEEATKAIKDAQDIGFENISIDLIFGSTTTSDLMWDHNLQQFFELQIPHLSAYSLTVEEKTALAHHIRKGTIEPIDEDKNYRHYLQLQKAIQKNGYHQYELSNYCIGDNYSKHNTSYWKGVSYIGVGPSAHSFNGKTRQWNVNNNSLYVRALKEGNSFYEREKLSEEDRYHEYLITHLRTKWGIQFDDLWNKFSDKIISHFQLQLTNLDQNMVSITPSSLVIKNEQLFQSDEIVRHLMK